MDGFIIQCSKGGRVGPQGVDSWIFSVSREGG